MKDCKKIYANVMLQYFSDFYLISIYLSILFIYLFFYFIHLFIYLFILFYLYVHDVGPMVKKAEHDTTFYILKLSCLTFYSFPSL
jgi:hypothetical protein